MENTAIWGYLRFTKSSPNAQKVFKRIRRIHGKNLYGTQRPAAKFLVPDWGETVKYGVGLSVISMIRTYTPMTG
jgi:hypothetical protein